jgi:hypothetical protein
MSPYSDVRTQLSMEGGEDEYALTVEGVQSELGWECLKCDPEEDEE